MGTISGVGRQAKGSIFTLIGYWVIGIPIGAVQIFYLNYGIQALWFGPTMALMFNSLAYYGLIVSINWKRIVEES